MTKKAYEEIVYGNNVTNKYYKEEIEEQYLQDKRDYDLTPFSIFGRKVKVNEGDEIIITSLSSVRAKQLALSLCDEKFKEFETLPFKNNVLLFSKYIPYKCDRLNIIYDYEVENDLAIFQICKEADVKIIYDDISSKQIEGIIGEFKDITLKKDNIFYGKDYTLNIKENIAKRFNTIFKEVDDFESEKDKKLIIADIPILNIMCNYGDLEKITLTIEKIDEELGKLSAYLKEKGWILAISSTHGCAEKMIDRKNI